MSWSEAGTSKGSKSRPAKSREVDLSGRTGPSIIIFNIVEFGPRANDAVSRFKNVRMTRNLNFKYVKEAREPCPLVDKA